MPRSPKNSRRSTGTSDRARNFSSASTGIRFSVSSAVSRISRIRVLEQQHQDGQLFVRARRQRALRRLQPDVALDLASFEEIQQRRRTHQRACR